MFYFVLPSEEDDDEFVVVSPDEVPSPQEAEDLVKNIDSSKEVPVKLTADDDDDFVSEIAIIYSIVNASGVVVILINCVVNVHWIITFITMLCVCIDCKLFN